MKEIRLHGSLRKKFGKSFKLDVKSPAEAIRALCAILPGFEQHLVSDKTAAFKVFFGAQSVGKDELQMPSSNEVIRIAPAVGGAKNGIGKIIVGIVLVVVAFYTGGAGYGALAKAMSSVGYSMILGGVSSMLFSASTDTGSPEAVEDTPSFAFNGVKNTKREGGPVPVCYGRGRIGGYIISSGLTTDDIAV